MRRKVTATESLYMSIEASVGSFSITRAIKGTFLTAKPQISAIKGRLESNLLDTPPFSPNRAKKSLGGYAE
jgi:hypothetical protein